MGEKTLDKLGRMAFGAAVVWCLQIESLIFTEYLGLISSAYTDTILWFLVVYCGLGAVAAFATIVTGYNIYRMARRLIKIEGIFVTVSLALFAVISLATAPASAQKYAYLGLPEDYVVTASDMAVVLDPVKLVRVAPVTRDSSGSPQTEEGYYVMPFRCANREVLELSGRASFNHVALRGDTLLVGVVMTISGQVARVVDTRQMYFFTNNVAGDPSLTSSWPYNRPANMYVVASDNLSYSHQFENHSLYSNLDGRQAEIKILYLGFGQAILLEPVTVTDLQPVIGMEPVGGM